MQIPYRFIIINGLMILLLNACGFHLRGQVELPSVMSVTYIKAERSDIAPPSELAPVLRRTLEANGAVVTRDLEKATAVVEILGERVRQRTLATTDDDEVRSYTLVYRVNFTVSLADGSQLIAPEEIATSQDFIYRETDVLGRAEGEQLIFQDMLADVSQSIIRRIQAAAG